LLELYGKDKINAESFYNDNIGTGGLGGDNGKQITLLLARRLGTPCINDVATEDLCMMRVGQASPFGRVLGSASPFGTGASHQQN